MFIHLQSLWNLQNFYSSTCSKMSSCSNESLSEVIWRSYDFNNSVHLSFSIENFPHKIYTFVVITTLVIVCIGLAANGITFIIHIQPVFRTNFHLLLAGLAVWDILNLLFLTLLLRTHAESVVTWDSGDYNCYNYKEYWEYPIILVTKSAGCLCNFSHSIHSLQEP